ncbi:MAG: protein-disulfide reductase DsbD [Burkholderiales bacterium]
MTLPTGSRCGVLTGVLRILVGPILAVVCAAAYPQGSTTSTRAAPQLFTAPAASGPLTAIRSWLSGAASEAELLPPDQAFRIAVRARDADTLIVELTPAKDYYLYRDRISFSVEDTPGIAVDEVRLPKGEPKADPTFGTVEVFHHPFEAVIALKRTGGRVDHLSLRATYQGCNEPVGVCYPPIDKTVAVSLTDTSVQSATSALPPTSTQNAASPVLSDDSPGHIHRLFATGNTWALVAAFFGFGLLLAFTPCMLPMIPILSGIIVGQGQRMTRRHALGLSSSYVLGMAITYALAGVAAGLAGTLLSAYLQNAWVLGGFAAIFVLLALSMFGFYELQLPTSLQSKFAAVANGIRGGRALGAFLMGVLSAVIVGPCVAAPLAGALLYIGQTHDTVLGGVALFSMAVGMGVPLLVVGATAGTLLPKAGAWMESVKRVFGVSMLAVAVYLVSPVIPAAVQQLLWAALLIVPAMYLHALDPLPAGAPGHRRLWKGVGVMALVTGVALLIGALSGTRDMVRPLAGLRAGSAAAPSPLAFKPVKSLAEFESRVRSARGRPVMLDFWAEWCVSCKELEQFVQARLGDTLVLRADVTANNTDDQALLKRFGLFGPPGIVFFDRNGQELPVQVIGFEPPERFLASLDRAFAP